ncbi:MAG: hypothetical protein AAB466_04775 [Verrucomicrobiota bacterium]
MKSFEREDIQFVEQGVDDLQREAAIGHLIRKRRLLFWSAVVMTLSAVTLFFTGFFTGRSSGGGTGFGFAAAIHWMLVFKYESELRLLMMIRRLKSL